MKLSKVIKLSDAFAAEVNVLRDYSYKNPELNDQKLRGYLPNKSSREIIKSILLSCPESTDKKLHLITASYGTGKSYLLLLQANLLANQNKQALDSLVDKIRDKEEYYKDKLFTTLDNHINNSDPFLVVIPDYGDPDFDHALLEGLKFALQKNALDYIPKTNYDEAIKTISHWEVKNQPNYKLLKGCIKNNTVDKFVEQLQAYNPSTYTEFKSYFKEISGATYPETHTSAFPVFADTAKEIRGKGFRGIAIIYDEFGEMLGKLINNSSSATGISVQHFLEDVKDKKENCNIVFIAASHQDPQTLRASKERELNKIIGRFEKHQLIVSEAEGEEIMGTIFIKEDPEKFKSIYKHSLFSEHLETIQGFKLYPDKDSNWIETKVLKNLYPLHPLSAYILPRLSAEFAQNTRSMFNFLSPSETKEGAFKYYLESKDVMEDDKLNLFTPDLLLDFFLKNIREDKGGRIQSLYEVYRIGKGKVNDPNHLSIIKNLFMLWVVSIPEIKPKREILFWAMNWEESRRSEFDNLLDDLVASEYIELNPTDKNYQFPDFGAAPLSKIIEEEAKKLDELTLSQCMGVWNEIVELENLWLHDHNNHFGSNRSLYTEVVNDVALILSRIKELENYYNKNTEYFGSGYLFYLVGRSEDEIEELKVSIKGNRDMLPYIVFATPVNIPQFDNLIKDTLHFKAVQNAAGRLDVTQNPSRFKNITDQLANINERLGEKIKTLYEPVNWKWNYQTDSDIEITSKPKFSAWINQKISLLFPDTPVIKDEALWYTEGNKGGKDRRQALDLLLNSDKDRIPLRDDSNNSADKRIIRNFFANIGLTVDRKRDKSIQYGEIINPDQSSQVYKAWKHIENKLKPGAYVNPIEIITPLLKAPFGYSEHIVKFLLTSYIRYESERIVIAESKRRNVQAINLDIIDSINNKPSDYLIRKIEITGPELRYLNQLKKLFDKQDVNTWMDVAQKFIGVGQYLTPLHKGIIRDSGDKELQIFFQSLETLKIEFSVNGADKEKVSQDFFQEHLPTLLLHEGRSVVEDPLKISGLVNRLDAFKKYPFENEIARKMEAIQAMTEEVFGRRIVTKSEIFDVVLEWFKKLPSSNQNGKYDSEIIKVWLLEIKMQTIPDPFDLYLDKLNEKPFKDWDNFSYEKHRFVSRFQEYKKTIEEYTKSPLEVLQIIARDVFEKSAAECNSENVFDGFFKQWWEELPKLYKAEQYSLGTNLLLSQIILPGAVKARYLETIPQAWKASNDLAAHIPQQWENWSNADATEVAEKYKACLSDVINWKPPVEERQLYILLGNIFGDTQVDSLSLLYPIMKTWYDGLADRTKETNWIPIDEYVQKFLSSLSQQDTVGRFILEEGPSTWKLPVFKEWNDTVLKTYTTNFRILKERIENYKRPLFEVVEKFEEKVKEKSSNTEEFSFNLITKIKESDAYKNKIDSATLNDPISAILYDTVKKSSQAFNLSNLILLLSPSLGVDSNWHLWSDKEEKNFISALKKGIDNLLKWKFPEAEKLKKAKVKVKKGITEMQNELGLDENQMRKVLIDIIDGK